MTKKSYFLFFNSSAGHIQMSLCDLRSRSQIAPNRSPILKTLIRFSKNNFTKDQIVYMFDDGELAAVLLRQYSNNRRLYQAKFNHHH